MFHAMRAQHRHQQCRGDGFMVHAQRQQRIGRALRMRNRGAIRIRLQARPCGAQHKARRLVKMSQRIDQPGFGIRRRGADQLQVFGG